MTTGTPTRTPAVRPGYALFILTVIYIFNSMDRSLLAILAEPIRNELKITDTQFGILTGLAFAFFYTMFGIPAGWLADRFGRVRIIALACTFWSLCSASGALATSFATLALSRIGVGLGEAGGTAPSYSLISSLYREEKRSTALGLFHLGAAFAMLISATLCAWIATHYGWRWAIAAISLPGTLFALLLWLTLPEPPQPAQTALDEPSPFVSIATFARNPLLRLTALTAGCTAFSNFAMAAWLPAFLMRIKGMTLDDIAIWYGISYALAYAVGLAGSGWLTDRLARRDPRAYARVPMVAVLCMIPAIALATAAPGWPLSFLFWLIAFTLANMFVAPLLTIIQNNSPDRQRSVFSALFLLVNNLIGAGLGPLYVGMVSDGLKGHVAGDPLAYGLAALIPVALLAAFLYSRLSKRL